MTYVLLTDQNDPRWGANVLLTYQNESLLLGPYVLLTDANDTPPRGANVLLITLFFQAVIFWGTSFPRPDFGRTYY